MLQFSLETSCVDVCSAVFLCCFIVKWQIVPCAWILTLQFTKVAKMKDWRQKDTTSLSAVLQIHSILKSPRPRGKTVCMSVSKLFVMHTGSIACLNLSLQACFLWQSWLYISVAVSCLHILHCFHFMGDGYRIGQTCDFCFCWSAEIVIHGL